MTYRLLISLLVLMLAGCSTCRPTLNPPVYRMESKASAQRVARDWVTGPPYNHTWSVVGCTGSMCPLMMGDDLLLLARYDGQPLQRGQIVVYDRGDWTHVVHRIFLMNRFGVFMFGDNCRTPDGWFPFSKVQYVCAGIVTFPHERKPRKTLAAR